VKLRGPPSSEALAQVRHLRHG